MLVRAGQLVPPEPKILGFHILPDVAPSVGILVVFQAGDVPPWSSLDVIIQAIHWAFAEDGHRLVPKVGFRMAGAP